MSATADDGFASLSAGLLARKGAARPAMRPGSASLEDIGWNDLTGGAPAPSRRVPITFDAVVPDVVRQQEAIAQAFEARPLLATKRRAFTFRLDPDRHARLRAACAAAGISAQRLLTDTLDRLLADDARDREGQAR